MGFSDLGHGIVTLRVESRPHCGVRDWRNDRVLKSETNASQRLTKLLTSILITVRHFTRHTDLNVKKPQNRVWRQINVSIYKSFIDTVVLRLSTLRKKPLKCENKIETDTYDYSAERSCNSTFEWIAYFVVFFRSHQLTLINRPGIWLWTQTVWTYPWEVHSWNKGVGGGWWKVLLQWSWISNRIIKTIIFLLGSVVEESGVSCCISCINEYILFLYLSFLIITIILYFYKNNLGFFVFLIKV